MKNLISFAPMRSKQGFQRGVRPSILLLASVGFLTGCSGFVSDAPTESVTGALIKGNVHGGQSPVNRAAIQLYAACSTVSGPCAASGYGAASVPLLTSSVKTDAGGNFTITGDYSCPASPNDQVYLVATGGDSGGGTNANLALMAALGACGNLTAETFIAINEVTTVASAYALSGFMADYAHVGTSSGNYIGLQNAMATVTNLVNISTGAALSTTPAYATPPTGTTSATFYNIVPQSEIYTLADILAYCVNTNGVGGSSTNCATLFSSSGTSTTTGGVSGTPDTIQAALSIAQNPGVNVANLYSYDLPAAPFAPTLSSAPNDWTVSLNFTSGGLGGQHVGAHNNLSVSTALAIDGSGNIWVTNSHNNTVTELNNLGAPISTNSTIVGTTYTAGGFTGSLSTPESIALDTNGNAWVGNLNGFLSEFGSNGSLAQSVHSGGLSSGDLDGVAVDGFNNIWVADRSDSGGLVAAFNNSGTALSFSPITGFTSPGGAIAVDNSNNIWIANSGSDADVVKINGTAGGTAGAILASSNNVLSDALGSLAIDQSGDAWVPSGPQEQVFAVTGPGTIAVADTYTPFGVSNPGMIGIDGAGTVWVASGGGAEGQSVVANLTAQLENGNLVSGEPNSGYGVGGSLDSPLGGGIDRSGNVWVLNGNTSSSVTEFVGLGAPSYTPLAAAAAANRVDQRP